MSTKLHHISPVPLLSEQSNRPILQLRFIPIIQRILHPPSRVSELPAPTLQGRPNMTNLLRFFALAARVGVAGSPAPQGGGWVPGAGPGQPPTRLGRTRTVPGAMPVAPAPAPPAPAPGAR